MLMVTSGLLDNISVGDDVGSGDGYNRDGGQVVVMGIMMVVVMMMVAMIMVIIALLMLVVVM
jgi:hypothetical protein